ncbi:GntR family transcriptional regulator [Pedobacter jamesrossensis]|uniref:GntR family transcriptional regulator n=1 Tax=Pedobacter jamesrossensis TaxID=1908238 RepID=A0ABV8NL96_9SPHI
MKYQIIVNKASSIAKYVQIAEVIKKDIEAGRLENGSKLPSINEFSRSHIVARDTVEKAYNSLKRTGYIKGVPGKGNFVAKVYQSQKTLKILIILNKLSSFKKEVYEAFLETMGGRAKVDMQIHHYNVSFFKDIIHETEGEYHYYVVMPHFSAGTSEQSYLEVLNSIQNAGLIVLDKKVELANEVVNVYQDFERDIFEALSVEKEILEKYSGITLIFNKLTNHPEEIIEGVRSFCEMQEKEFNVIEDADKVILKKGTAYITLTDDELAMALKKIKGTKHKLGRDIGILSFNETVLKELLGITVVSTDFSAMGRIAAEMILGKSVQSIRNEFRFIKRNSL